MSRKPINRGDYIVHLLKGMTRAQRVRAMVMVAREQARRRGREGR